MVYIGTDGDGWLEVASMTPFDGCHALESLEPFDLSGLRMGAHRWNGQTLVFGPGRLEALERAQKAAEQAAERQAMAREAALALAVAQINTIPADDATALRWRVLYPAWEAGVEYKTGEKVQREDKLYRCLQGHTAQAGWEPETAESLWTEICESHAGTADDPIPYSGNMALESGKYYAQDSVTYRCTRDTVNPVYNPLADLVGLYVEAADAFPGAAQYEEVSHGDGE